MIIVRVVHIAVLFQSKEEVKVVPTQVPNTSVCHSLYYLLMAKDTKEERCKDG